MDADVSGTWTGTEYTDGLAHAQGFESGGWGGPPKTYDVRLTITYQGDYESFAGPQWVSAVSGYFQRSAGGYNIELVPIGGFVNRDGLVKLSFFRPTLSVDCAFNGRLKNYALHRKIAGDWTETSWSNGLVLYRLGTVSVSQRRSLVYRGAPSPYRWK